MMFGPNDLQRPIAQLKRLKEGDSFFEYVDTFVSLVSRVELPEENRVAMFVEGLKLGNQKFIIILSPKTLQQAISYAKTLTTDADPYVGRRREASGEMVKPYQWQGNRSLYNPHHSSNAGEKALVHKPVTNSRFLLVQSTRLLSTNLRTGGCPRMK